MFKKGNWKTTLAGIIGAVVMALGIFLPEKFDPETQAEVNSAVNELLTAIGSVILVVGNLVAKDPA